MGKLVWSTNITLDGVVEDPDGKEGFERGGWFGRSGGEDLGAWTAMAYDEAQRAAALLLGRHSDEWFAARWPSREGGFADRLNGMPKHVASSTATEPSWTNAVVLTGDIVGAVSRLKQEVDGDILIYASYVLGRTLLDNDLVDELRLSVFPVVIGSGTRLFGDTGSSKSLRLIDTVTVGSGLVHLTYRVGGED